MTAWVAGLSLQTIQRSSSYHKAQGPQQKSSCWHRLPGMVQAPVKQKQFLSGTIFQGFIVTSQEPHKAFFGMCRFRPSRTSELTLYCKDHTKGFHFIGLSQEKYKLTTKTLVAMVWTFFSEHFLKYLRPSSCNSPSIFLIE